MKSKKSTKKLKINKLTVSNLDMAQQKTIKGGRAYYCTLLCTVNVTCPACPGSLPACLSDYVCE